MPEQKKRFEAPELNARLDHLYHLVLRFDALYRRVRALEQAWNEESPEHKREISINLTA
jgi:hypothetical protein